MFDSVIRSVVAEEYHTVFIIVQTDLGHLFALKHGSGSTSPDVVTSLEIYVLTGFHDQWFTLAALTSNWLLKRVHKAIILY